MWTSRPSPSHKLATPERTRPVNFHAVRLRGQKELAGNETDRGGSVGALPTSCSVFILHDRVDVICRSGPFAPGAKGKEEMGELSQT